MVWSCCLTVSTVETTGIALVFANILKQFRVVSYVFIVVNHSTETCASHLSSRGLWCHILEHLKSKCFAHFLLILNWSIMFLPMCKVFKVISLWNIRFLCKICIWLRYPQISLTSVATGLVRSSLKELETEARGSRLMNVLEWTGVSQQLLHADTRWSRPSV